MEVTSCSRTITPQPIQWLSDNGSCFRAYETIEFAVRLGLVPCFTPVRSPQSNGIGDAPNSTPARLPKRTKHHPVRRPDLTAGKLRAAAPSAHRQIRRRKQCTGPNCGRVADGEPPLGLLSIQARLGAGACERIADEPQRTTTALGHRSHGECSPGNRRSMNWREARKRLMGAEPPRFSKKLRTLPRDAATHLWGIGVPQSNCVKLRPDPLSGATVLSTCVDVVVS
jgi:hypothetical protein